MSGSRVLGERDVNVTMTDAQPLAKDVKSMEYHRQVLQSRIAQEPYVTAPRHNVASFHAKLLLRGLPFPKSFVFTNVYAVFLVPNNTSLRPTPS